MQTMISARCMPRIGDGFLLNFHERHGQLSIRILRIERGHMDIQHHRVRYTLSTICDLRPIEQHEQCGEEHREGYEKIFTQRLSRAYWLGRQAEGDMTTPNFKQ